MHNKPGLKKCIAVTIAVMLMAGILFSILMLRLVQLYNRQVNESIARVLVAVHDKYPRVSYNELMEIFEDSSKDAYKTAAGKLSEKYGIDAEKETFVEDNQVLVHNMMAIGIIFFVVEAIIVVLCFLIYDRKRDKGIDEITECIRNINNKIYHIDVDGNTEEELSILKNEIYKITIMLKEDAENSKNAKLQLKESLLDISHQLKTPLTAITIMLDNLVDEPDMDKDTRLKFLRKIHHEAANISFMVQSLLKLSRIESDTVVFVSEEIELIDIVNEAVQNISALSDLKNVKVSIIKRGSYRINCDRKWQIEAVSNILKNSIEHTPAGNHVDIDMDDNHVYTSLVITNYGETISKKDIPHIFERFYRGENSSADGLGIGLALAKSIIESCGGQIIVESTGGRTTFHIKYFKE